MKVGSLVFATDQGLGILAKAFYDHGVITDVMVIRHGTHPTHSKWYPGAEQVTNMGDKEQQNRMRQFCASMDVMLFFETPFHWPLLQSCRTDETKTVLMPMHECLHKRVWDYPPDLFLCPSLLDEECIALGPGFFRGHPRIKQLSVPVEVPWRQRRRAEVFVHNAGHGGLLGRNGTKELIEALKHVKSPIKFILRSQESLRWSLKEVWKVNSLIRLDGIYSSTTYESLFTEGDVFVFPEKFNGLSLPLQEARAAGMLVMCGDRFPMNQWLPPHALIPVSGYRKNRIGPPYQEFDEAIIDPKHIAAKIDEWYGCDISEYSLSGKAWAESMSWGSLKPKYIKVLEDLCDGR